MKKMSECGCGWRAVKFFLLWEKVLARCRCTVHIGKYHHTTTEYNYSYYYNCNEYTSHKNQQN